MSEDSLDRLISWAEGAERAANSLTRPPQHLAAAAPALVPHTWRKGLLGGPMRCAVCKIRLDQADPNVGCRA